MRQVAVFVALLAGGGLFFGAHGQATAGPAMIAAPVVSHSVVEDAGYRRRYCRRYGCGPEVVLQVRSFPSRKWTSMWTCRPWSCCSRRAR